MYVYLTKIYKYLLLGALKDFDKPQGAEGSPKKNVKVSNQNNGLCFQGFKFFSALKSGTWIVNLGQVHRQN